MNFKNTGLLLLVLVLLHGCSDVPPAETAAPQPVVAAAPETPAVTVADAPTPAAPTTTRFQDLQGAPLELSAYAGKKVFLNYWATWCAPCIREIPSIARAAAVLEQENYVFLLASDESLDTINDFLIDRGFSGTFIKLNGFFAAHGIQAVPSSSLYDESGTLVQTWSGAFEWDTPEMLEAVRTGAPVEPAAQQ